MRGQNDPESGSHAWCWTIDGATGRRKTVRTVAASQKLTKRLKHREKHRVVQMTECVC